MKNKNLPKTYQANKIEADIYKKWENSGYFNPDKCIQKNICDKDKKPFSIAMPPPNATGTLHLGHAMMLAIEDIMARYNRMLGKATLWLPGTDHAAIATQAKVENLLIKKGIKNPRQELGREKLLTEIKKFVEESKSTIRKQIRKMGSSCDWSRECYTLDEQRNKAVNEFFRLMYEDGLIYHGYRVVNWSVRGQSTCSDDELEYKTQQGKLYYFKYSKDIPITIATTRPETKLGDTAIAVNPEDKRYKKYIGKTFTVKFFAKEPLKLKVIADKAVDPNFGTGALGVTPAHSQIDFELSQKHNLNLIQVIGLDGKMTEQAGELFQGLNILEAREKLVDLLKQNNLLEKIEDIEQNVAISDRFKDVIEPIPMVQWFIDVNKKAINWKGKKLSIKQVMQDVVKSKMIEFIPQRFNSIYFNWIDNLRDWCISRQIWWGHQIPIWYKISKKDKELWDKYPESSSYLLQKLNIKILETKFSLTKPESTSNYEWIQDPDTLDTWFSSALWTFSTLGWPDNIKNNKIIKGSDLDRFHPTSVLETGYDIIFFWVARMILATTYCLRKSKLPENKCIPFEKVYLHGIVKDKFGKKMSKSRPETAIDPLDMIEKYGTDALRLSMIVGNTPGNDIRLYEEKIAGYRNFVNKLWNISRFILTKVEKTKYIEKLELKEPTDSDKWILLKLQNIIQQTTKNLDNYKYSIALEELRNFTWDELADWYLEISKAENNKDKEQILMFILQNLLKLWHPFAPFITEYIWSMIKNTPQKLLLVEKWPSKDFIKFKNKEFIQNFDLIKTIITKIRQTRSEHKIEPGKFLDIKIKTKKQKIIEQNLTWLKKLARINKIEFTENKPKDKFIKTADKDFEIFIKTDNLNLEEQKQKIERQKKELQKYIKTLEKQLANKEFLQKAPEKVVNQVKEKLNQAKQKLEKL